MIRLIKPSHKIETKIDGEKILKNIETYGRVCYKSEKIIDSYSAKKFVSALIKKGHHSVIEHESITVRFICDRGISHELVRHRLASFSQESTRYCNYKDKMTFIIPPWVEIEPGEYDSFAPMPNKSQIWFYHMIESKLTYNRLIKAGELPQQARSILPNSLKTEIIMTANLREWRHVLDLRCSKAAHPQMRELMLPLLKELGEKIPIIFDDIYEKYFKPGE